jgi:hypothetical protein
VTKLDKKGRKEVLEDGGRDGREEEEVQVRKREEEESGGK